jgi:hypothetical protein
MVYLRVRIMSVNGLATALIALSGLVLLHWLIKRGARKVGTAIGSALRAPTRALLTRYYRRKVIRQIQEKNGSRAFRHSKNSDDRVSWF